MEKDCELSNEFKVQTQPQSKKPGNDSNKIRNSKKSIKSTEKKATLRVLG